MTFSIVEERLVVEERRTRGCAESVEGGEGAVAEGAVGEVVGGGGNGEGGGGTVVREHEGQVRGAQVAGLAQLLGIALLLTAATSLATSGSVGFETALFFFFFDLQNGFLKLEGIR